MVKVKMSALERLRKEAIEEDDFFLFVFLRSLVSSLVKKEQCGSEIWVYFDYPEEVFERLIQDGDLKDSEVDFV